VSGLHNAVEPFSGAADRGRQQHNARSASSWRRSRWQAGQPCPSISQDHASDEQASMIRHYIAWRNRNTRDRRLGKIVNRANVA
jgi:hypothetical protein